MYVGYRYYEQIELPPLFPFGHGLSYTTFSLSSLTLRPDEQSDEVSIRCTLMNTGSRAGAEVIQVYVAPVSPPIRRPAKELKGMMKRSLEAGESADVRITINGLRATSFWHEQSDSWCSHAGIYEVLVGTSSAGAHLSTPYQVKRTRYWSGL